MKKTIFFTTLLASFLAITCVTFSSKNAVNPVNADNFSLNGDGDQFRLLDKSFDESESFVYTADVHFRGGQAGALAFGAQENDHYFVINLDRYENHIKLLYFKQGEGGFVDELYSCDFIGHGKLMQEEWAKVNPKVREIENVNIKVVLTREGEHAYVEFFVEGIKRFGIDSVIDLNNLEGKSYKYDGGYLGANCFNADIYLENIEYGHSDYSYFSEPYRNQYHLQPFSKWTNDPNGLCYYNGWYHVFYQTNPFGLGWSDMFWGHARSRDLFHWEFLPICLFPEVGGRDADRVGSRDAYMWSGCAIAYHHGMSEAVDALGWFPYEEGNAEKDGSGLLAIYTRDGSYQDQEFIFSNDEGLTWNKTGRYISHTLVNNNPQDWRDPKVFPLDKDGSGKVTVWGMTLSGYRSTRKGYFLKSTNLLDWSMAGDFYLPDPECVGAGFIKDESGETHAYLTNKSRTYLLGSFEYTDTRIIFKDEEGRDISTLSEQEMAASLKTLDFGPDTYASQSFYITDPTSDYCGKELVLNWFSGDLNASFCTGPGEYAGLRGRWNGGFTMPVEYGVKKVNGENLLSQKPITVDNNHLEKTQVVSLNNLDLNSSSDNPLKDVHTHIFEMEASIDVTNNSPITFKVDVGENEYMQLGWNETDGYYVDRTNLDDKGINTNIDWHVKYSSHILGNSNTKTFYVLSDNGGLEVFCENFSVSFYFVTTASMYSTGASLKADNAHVNSLKLNEIKSVWRGDIAPGEGKLYVSTDEVDLDDKFATSKFVTAWFSGNDALVWETLSNDGVVDIQTSNQGVEINAVKSGTAQIQVSAGIQSQIIDITVHESTFTSDLTFKKEGIVSGSWIMMEDAVIGEKTSGNAFLLAEETGSDFIFAGQFDIVSGTAAALVFRAASDMSSYLVANYDAGERIVKLWSTHGELARSGRIDVGTTNITISVKTSGTQVTVAVNGNNAINYTLLDNEPLSGHFGLNVFSGKAKFKGLSLVKENYEYVSGDLEVNLSVDDFVTGVYNLTLGNLRLEPGYYYQNNGKLYIRESYFKLLPESGRYEFKIVGSALTFTIKVDVTLPSNTLTIEDVTVQKGNNVVVYVGTTPVTTVSVNGALLEANQYTLKDYTLTITHEVFTEGENTVVLNENVSFKVTVVNLDEEVTEKEESGSTSKSKFVQWLSNFFKKIGDFFKNLFKGKKK